MAKANKFDFIETLKAHGFSSTTSMTGCPLFTLDLSKEVEVAWYGVKEFTIRVQVVFNPEMTCCMVNYYDGFLRPFKTKVHMSDKRAWNAIRETLKNKGFEIQEVA